MRNRIFTLHYSLMLIPGIVLLVMFNVVPMFGIAMAFKDYLPAMGFWNSEWVGLDNFQFMFILPDSKQILFNTIYISVMKIIVHLVVPLIFAIMLYEMRIRFLKKTIQTIVYLPYFLSWVLFGGAILRVLATEGLVNQMLGWVGIDPVPFLSSNQLFPFVLVFTDIWKDFGFGSIIYFAALAGINSSLFEAAEIDGASRIQIIRYITFPSLVPTIMLLAALSLQNVLNAGFDQVYNLYNPGVYESGDIIDTYVYRAGLQQAQYSLATAIGLMKSVVSLVLIAISAWMVGRFANYRIF